MLELKQITKVFNKDTPNPIHALRNVSLNLGQGEFVVLIGNNGAGKSTLLNAVAGVFEIDGGQILIDGRDVTGLPEFKRADLVGRVFQDPKEGVAVTLSLEENVSLGLLKGRCPGLGKCVSRSRRRQVANVLGGFGLGLESRLSDMALVLSGGQRQCLALCMATAIVPKILLLDEHDESLDPKTANLVMGLTEQIVRSHRITTIMVTHNLERAMHYGDRLLMMVAGEIVLDLRADERKKVGHSELLSFFEEGTKK